MRYKTVEEVVDFVSELRAKDTADAQLKIHIEFYNDGIFVGELDRDMCATYTTATLNVEYLLYYIVTGFKIEMRGDCVVFILSIKKPSSI